MTFNDLSFEEKVIIALKRKKLTYLDLGNLLGISAPYVSDIIKGNRKGTLYKEKIKEILDLN